MEEDFYPAAEKILTDIVLILRKDPKLNSMEIIPTTTNANKSPIHHEEHALGLESWCIQPVYCHAYHCVMNLRKNKQQYRDTNRLNMLLVGVLMINPDVTSFWNMRKELIIRGKLDPYFELHFTSVVLSRKPKSSDIYAHRKWTLNRIFQGYSDKNELLSSEMRVCEVAADRYSNNYHSWTHRLWCLNQGIPLQSSRVNYFLRELAWSQSWALQHVSDYSGFHYRQQVLSSLCDVVQTDCTVRDSSLSYQIETAYNECRSSRKCANNVDSPYVLKIIMSELVFNSGMIKRFEAHESLWHHRRFIIHLFVSYFPASGEAESNENWIFSSEICHSNGDGVPSEKNQKIDVTLVKSPLELVDRELKFLKEYETDKTNSMSSKYALRHRQWLSHRLNLEDFSLQ